MSKESTGDRSEQVPNNGQLSGIYKDVATYGFRCGIKSQKHLQRVLAEITPYAPTISGGDIPKIEFMAYNTAKDYYIKCLEKWFVRHAGNEYDRERVKEVFKMNYERGTQEQERRTTKENNNKDDGNN